MNAELDKLLEVITTSAQSSTNLADANRDFRDSTFKAISLLLKQMGEHHTRIAALETKLAANQHERPSLH